MRDAEILARFDALEAKIDALAKSLSPSLLRYQVGCKHVFEGAIGDFPHCKLCGAIRT